MTYKLIGRNGSEVNLLGLQDKGPWCVGCVLAHYSKNCFRSLSFILLSSR